MTGRRGMFRPSSTAYRDQNLVPMRSSACTASAGNSSSAAATPATGIGAALTRPLRIQERTAAMPARSHAGNGSTAERQQAIGANSRRHAASRPRFAHPVGAWRAATDARVLHLQQDLQPRRRDRRSRGLQRAPSAWCLPPSRRPTPRPATAGALKRREPGTDRKTTSKSVGQANLVPHGHAALRTTGPAPAACPEVRPARAPTPAPARSSRHARRMHR